MAYDGWIKFGGVELVNLSRTARLAEALGIDTVWTTSDSVQWIEALAASGGGLSPSSIPYLDVSTAPWYDPGFPASGEFAGVLPLSFAGLDDSTLESNPVEYVTDGGNPGRARNAMLPIVANVALVASTDRGAEFGLRWMNRVLRGVNPTGLCSGLDLEYLRFEGSDAPAVHRRNVRLTRGTSVTRKRRGACSSTWLATFTLTAGDPFEYGEPVEVVASLGTSPEAGRVASAVNLATSPIATNTDISSNGAGYSGNYWAGDSTRSLVAAGGDGPVVNGVALAYRRKTITPASVDSNRMIWLLTAANPDIPTKPGGTGALPVTPGRKYRISHYFRITTASAYTGNAAFVASGFTPDGLTRTAIAPSGSAVIVSGQWVRVTATFTAPAGATWVGIRMQIPGATVAAGDTSDITGLIVTDVTDDPAHDEPYFDGSTPTVGSTTFRWTGAVNASTSERWVNYNASGAEVVSSGSVTLIEEGCPVYDYSPVYDPLYPALVPSPTAPDFFPNGWGISEGETFDRFWARVTVPEPSEMALVPLLVTTSEFEARYVRVSILPGTADPGDQCASLFTAIMSYVPMDSEFYIDGRQRASYIWDGSSPSVRRSDSLVYGPDAEPLNWASFGGHDELIVTLDIFSDSDTVPGDVHVALSLIPKSD